MRSTNVMMKNNEFKHETSVKKYKFFENNQNKLAHRCIYQNSKHKNVLNTFVFVNEYDPYCCLSDNEFI